MTDGGAPLRFSVIVASRGRPSELARCLTAIRQIDHPAYEVIVVGCPAAEGEVARGGAEWVRFVPFDEANLSVARNLGIRAAAGDACAFTDDDSVPEPLWLRHHEDALRRFRASASVGFVRGPDGVRFQSRYSTIDCEGETRQEPDQSEAPFVPEPGPGRAVKLVGTNMAIRRDVLAELGGFDPAYRYYLEDSDLSLRLRRTGRVVAVAPLAEVHHGIAASAHRTAGRVSRDLSDIGRSTAIFLRRHGAADSDKMRRQVRSREEKRLHRAMVGGLCEPRDVASRLATFDRGWDEGDRLTLPELPRIGGAEGEFFPVPAHESGHMLLTSRRLFRRTALWQATAAARRSAASVTLITLSLTAHPPTVRYTGEGIWLHSVGQFRNAGSAGEGLKWCRFASCVEREIRRVANRRGIDQAILARATPETREFVSTGIQVQARAK